MIQQLLRWPTVAYREAELLQRWAKKQTWI